jgi:glycosyltransferase involved in cell wall biosynthesis
MLSAYTQVNNKIPATLRIVGDVRAGDDRQIFEEFKQLHPGTQTIVTGYVSLDDLPAYNSLIDAFVRPSLRDEWPNALLEAIACETIVSDCENGRLVSTNWQTRPLSC